MCGIVGIVDCSGKVEINEPLLKQMASPLKYRGPDQEGYYINEEKGTKLGFAHKRLSIIDLSDGGKQPMLSQSGNTIIVFNGEIYNYKLIKKSLINEGVFFKSESDTEVILNAYETYGIEKTLDLLEGMFAFALYDFRTQTCYIARDRFGEKPLYYSHINNALIFSSDIRSFEALNIKNEIDDYSLEYFFQEMTTPIENTIWKSIKKVLPANYLIYKEYNLESKKYWQLNYQNKFAISTEDAIKESERLLKIAVERRMVADVPVGTFLSGGIDSSLITLFAAQNSSSKIDTFSVGFEYEHFNELPYAKQVVKLVNSNHHEIILNPNDITVINELIDEYGEPFADSSMIPTYYVSKFAAKNVKVALGGDGGDEVFGGYGTYNQGWRMQQWANNEWLHPFMKLSSKLTKNEKTKYILGILNKDKTTIATALYRGMGFNSKELKKLLMKPEIQKTSMEIEYERISQEAIENTDNIFDTLLYGSIKTRLVNDYLVKTDRASMFASLELRTPFIDRDLVEFCSKLPYQVLMQHNQNKFLTKKIAEKYFSKEFIYRPKMGFGIPIGEWIKKEWKSEFYDILMQKQNKVLIDYNYISQLLEEHCNGKMDHTHKLWILYVFQKWILKQ